MRIKIKIQNKSYNLLKDDNATILFDSFPHI
jgi:hypothetical protein